MRLEYFQMIDEVEQLAADERRIRCRATVPDASPVFEGHFPGHPIVPGVLLVEAMAQASGYLLLALNGFQRMPFLAAIASAKLRDFVPPGTVLTLSALLEHEGSGYAVTRGAVTRDGKPVSEAELRFRILDFPSPELRDSMLGAGRRLGLA